MACTVVSILTTTPRLSPREAWEPIPSTSMESSSLRLPTMATTFEVPISSPTIMFSVSTDDMQLTNSHFMNYCQKSPPGASTALPHHWCSGHQFSQPDLPGLPAAHHKR